MYILGRINLCLSIKKCSISVLYTIYKTLCTQWWQQYFIIISWQKVSFYMQVVYQKAYRFKNFVFILNKFMFVLFLFWLWWCCCVYFMVRMTPKSAIQSMNCLYNFIHIMLYFPLSTLSCNVQTYIHHMLSFNQKSFLVILNIGDDKFVCLVLFYQIYPPTYIRVPVILRSVATNVHQFR